MPAADGQTVTFGRP